MSGETSSGETTILARKRCVPCEGGVPRLTTAEATELLAQIPHWHLSDDGLRIRRAWVLRDFVAAMEFFQSVAALAEEQGHHPDLHLERYRHVVIEIWTHAVGGLSENDFILAAQIDALPIRLRTS